MSFDAIITAGYLLGLGFIPVVLVRKRQPVSAVSWLLAVVFIPYFGVFFFLVFGASSIKRRLRRRVFHRSRFLRLWVGHKHFKVGEAAAEKWSGMDRYTSRVGGSPATDGNHAKFYAEGNLAFKDKYNAIKAATHHIHLEYFILQNDEAGRSLIELLCEKASQGVEVRLLVDGVGSYYADAHLKKLIRAGGKAAFFLPSKIFKIRFSFGLRNHRKILICDGQVAFMGGMNVGNEYLSRVKRFGYWRDTHVKIVGPAVLALQQVFVEDWDFASGELLVGDNYFPMPSTSGSHSLQISWSGPDQETNATRETYFAAMTAARKKLWISTPYFVPDNALLTALRCAALRGVDVRILTQSYPPDHHVPYWAGCYFWDELMSAGVRIFQYKKGMMHAKVMLADGMWAVLGSANMDIRSIRLNFEVLCHVHTPTMVMELEDMFKDDLKSSKEVLLKEFRSRRWYTRLAENISRLFSPLL